jgi:hypothetical protein
MTTKDLLVLALCCLTGAGAAAAVEGKWTPEQVLDQDPAWLRSLGLEIPPGELWHRDGGGLLEAAVRIGGCTASFISDRGLLITNHHCAFSILQQHSTTEHDLITDGYLAAGGRPELPGSNFRATVPHRTTDVTAAIEAAAAAAGADDLARYKAIERKKKEMVAACEAPEKAAAAGAAPRAAAVAVSRCEVATYDGGLRYQLAESLEYPDVRLVYAPPRGIGDFGGDDDNWSWPRHAGDFALLRVYAGTDGKPAPHVAGNVPLVPPHFFPLTARGMRPGDFVMIAGYPGTTFRSLLAPETRERAELYYPHLAQLLGAWLEKMEAAARSNAAAGIALADRIKSLSNVEKNVRGQIDGLRRGHVVERKAAADRAVRAWAATQAAGRTSAGATAAVAAYQELSRLVEERQATWERDFLLAQARQGAKPLDLALTLVRHAHEAAKSDLEREPAYMDRNRDRLAEGLRRDQTRLHRPTEEALLADQLQRFAALPAAARVPAVEALVAGLPPSAGGAGGAGGGGTPAFEPKALAALAADLLARSRVADLDERLKMFGESETQLRARHDPLLDLAAGLDAALRQSEEADHRFRGAGARLRPAWQRAVLAQAGRPIAPDANGTLRVTFAHLKGYSPRDGVWMEPQTRLAGLVAKQTGKAPFDAPPALIAAAPRAAASPWADAGLQDLPIDFLADADTTGGNSGSPVLNGRGELVGVNFDRVWENVANDFGYNPEVARNISVDVRYLLWVLATFHGAEAGPLFEEMRVAAPPPAGQAASPSSGAAGAAGAPNRPAP